jgi:hypothetical protein
LCNSRALGLGVGRASLVHAMVHVVCPHQTVQNQLYTRYTRDGLRVDERRSPLSDMHELDPSSMPANLFHSIAEAHAYC